MPFFYCTFNKLLIMTASDFLKLAHDGQLQQCDIGDITVKGCKLHLPNFTETVFYGTTFAGVKFISANFTSVLFESVIFDACEFHGCNFDRSKFDACEFYGCTFYNCDLAGAHIDLCEFEGTEYIKEVARRAYQLQQPDQRIN